MSNVYRCKSVCIIGGGAAGIFCAIVIKKNNKKIRVVVLEKQPRILRKLLATGNGRCNFTNINLSIDNYYGENPGFAAYALQNFPPAATIGFFSELGILHKTEADGKCYPNSMQAASVVDCLRLCAEHHGVEIITGFEVSDITQKENEFVLRGETGVFYAEYVVAACGGAASTGLGGSQNVYSLLTRLNKQFTVSPISSALVQLKTEKSIIHGLSGVSVTAMVSFYSANQKLGRRYGDLIFTEYGLSGNTIFSLSVFCHKYKDITANIDFLPEYSQTQVIELLTLQKQKLFFLNAENFLSGIIHKKLGLSLMKLVLGKLSTPVSLITGSQLKQISTLLKGFDIKITGTTGLQNAQVTAGGIITDSFDDKTMQSKYIKGLYAAGELLDIYGDCGGYNLQWAWSSAYAAGIDIAKKV